jgi:hypothetical protein
VTDIVQEDGSVQPWSFLAYMNDTVVAIVETVTISEPRVTRFTT